MIDAHRLTAFVAVAEQQSFTKAATRLQVVQSAISAAIRNLERELGSDLFDRTTHGVVLTSAGHALLPPARAALEALQAAEDAVNEAAGGIRGAVVMGVMQAPSLRTLRLAERILAFSGTHPGVKVSLRNVGGSANMAQSVRDGDLDFAFAAALPSPMLGDLHTYPVTSEPMALLVPPAHALAGADRVALRDTAEEVFVDVPEGWGSRTIVDRAFAAHDLTRQIAYELNDAPAIIDFVAHGLGVTIIPPSFAIGSLDVVMVPLDAGEVPAFETCIVVSKVRRLSAAAAALLGAMRRDDLADPSAGRRNV